MKQSYIIDAIRTPIGSFGGSLSSVRADDLAALPIKELIKRNPEIPLELIEDVIAFGVFTSYNSWRNCQ
jgi:acetyl-CoA acyltransferase